MGGCAPGTMPCLLSSSTMVEPVVVFWYRVSSNKMAPEMYWPRPGVVQSSSRYACTKDAFQQQASVHVHATKEVE